MSNKNQIKEVEDIEEVSDSELEIAEDDFPKKKRKPLMNIRPKLISRLEVNLKRFNATIN